MSLVQTYCGADLLCYHSFEGLTYEQVRFVFSLACAVHIGFLVTLCRRLI